MSDVGRGRGPGAGDDPRGGGDAPTASPWHWVTAGVGLVIVLAAFAYLVRDGFARRDVPHPVITAAADTAVATAGGWLVPLRVRNDGGVAVADLHVRAELRAADGTVVEEREATLDYVPPGSTRRGGVVFAQDPAAGRVEVRPLGFEIP